MFAFLALLFILMLIYFFTSDGQKEGFESVPSYKITIPTTIPITPAPPARNIDDSNVKPSDLPGKLPVAPYQQIAAMSPLPYQDTALLKANHQQLINQLELLKGFLSFEAQEISERSDPNIQLPLNTARSDFHVLQSEVDVLNRNPGIQPTITLLHLNEISSNLAHLQRQVRLIGSAGTLQGPVYEFIQEGFSNLPVPKAPQAPQAPQVVPSNTNNIASVADVERFIGGISAEIIRLTASGTNNPINAARVKALTQIKNNVNTILEQVKSKKIKPEEIPILKKDINAAFPILGDLSKPLPQIIQMYKLPPWLANLVPADVANDPEMSKQVNSLINKYADTIVNGLSASFSVKYTSPRDTPNDSTISKTGFPSTSDLKACSGNIVKNEKMDLPFGGTSITDTLALNPHEAGRGPSQFDWESRAKEIEAQVKKRGLHPKDFGINPPNTKVSNDFSWKGYTRMICTRLQATTDPSLPETCGCPPMDWKGWRISK